MGSFPTEYSKWLKAVQAGMNAEEEFDCRMPFFGDRAAYIESTRERAASLRRDGYDQGCKDEEAGVSVIDGIAKVPEFAYQGEIECWVRGYCQARSTRDRGVVDPVYYMPRVR